jgi:two-component system, OmpR family, response regulator
MGIAEHGQRRSGETGYTVADAEANVAHMKILVIEDDLEAAAYMTKAFREAGIIADHASDGESGLFMGTENTYDVMVVDRMPPGWSLRHQRATQARHRHAGPHPLGPWPGR